MPASSKKQQKFMGIVRSIQKGEAPAGKFSKAAQKAAKSMKKSSVKKYAKTKHDDLPTKKESTAAYKKSLEKIARDKQLKMISKKDKEILMKIAKMMREDRDYKDEYKKFQSSTKAKKYRAELNKYNRKKGTYGNGDGKDASHKGGKIVGFESQSKNRGRAEKSRLKKESIKKIVKEEVQKILNESVGSKKYDGRDWFWPHDYRHYLRDASPAQRKKIHDAWLKIGVPVKKTGLKISDRYLEPKKNQLKKAWTIVRKVVAPKELGMPIPESVNEAMSEPQRFKVYNSLKKGDIVSIKYDSSIQKGTKYIPYVVTKGKTKLMKGKIERIILKNPSNPRFKAYLYNRDGDVSLALGDMAASIVDMKKGKVKESVNEKIRPAVQKLLKQKGYSPIFQAIDNSKRQFKQMRYSRGEIQDTLIDMFGDEDPKILQKIKESVNERMDKRQAGETLKQLGGNKFIAMTGAKQFSVGPKGMGFRIGRNAKSINYIRIDLKSTDLYDMEFIRIRGSKIKVVKKVTGVYNDQLQKMFTKYTGMYTSL